MVWAGVMDGAIIIGGAVLRSVVGWGIKAFKDNKIEGFEVKELLATVLSVGSLSFIAYMGYGALSVDNAAVLGMVSGYLADKLFSLAKAFVEAHKKK